MEGLEYLLELLDGLPRAGPGDNRSTRRAYSYLTGIPSVPQILDIGCGPGMQTLELARLSHGTIIALDNHQPFLDALMQDAEKENLDKSIISKKMSMFEMDFPDSSFDIVWSEGALFIMGFQKALRRCYQLVKPSGFVAVTEAVLLKEKVPSAVRRFWKTHYKGIMTIEGNLALIQKQGFAVVAHFTLPQSAWMDEYYKPIQTRLPRLQQKYMHNGVALAVFDSMEDEIQMYKQYQGDYGYEFFVMQKPA